VPVIHRCVCVCVCVCVNVMSIVLRRSWFIVCLTQLVSCMTVTVKLAN
jgi:hypothetical protein